MSYFHSIKTIEDQERMLKKILSLQTQIRARREKTRLTNNSQNEKYTKIFEPITRTLKNLTDIPTTTTISPYTDGKNLIDFKTPANIIDVNDNNVHKTPTLIPNAEYEIKAEDDDNDLFSEIVKSIPARERDDGVLGLDIKHHRIGDNTFTVKGNILTVHNDDNRTETTFEINDYDIWKLLLTQRPKTLMELKTIKGDYIPAVKDYIDIVDKLNLIEVAQRDHPYSFKNRSKYKLIESFSAKGSGFLFSVSPPPFLRKQKKKKTATQTVKPSTVVIPSDKKGLMRALLQALAELRAGNTSMRNFVVPLAKEAKRKKILPHNLLSADEETWVFA